jgi:hypothetical protein
LQQQTGTSARVLDVHPSQPASVDAPQPTVAESQTKHKALTDAEAQPKRQKSVSIPTSDPTLPSQPESADATKQAVNPPAQGTSSVIVSQGPTTDETIENIPLASLADPPHGTLQAASSSQRQEIALKQVSRLTYPIYNIHTCP